jgi:hypothetical protein
MRGTRAMCYTTAINNDDLGNAIQLMVLSAALERLKTFSTRSGRRQRLEVLGTVSRYGSVGVREQEDGIDLLHCTKQDVSARRNPQGRQSTCQ